jgi:hypothetical protein
MIYRYRLLQIQKDGSLWRQPDAHCSDGEYQQIAQVVIAGYLSGEPRWAETADTGMFLFGIDRHGKDHKTGTSCPDFSI